MNVILRKLKRIFILSKDNLFEIRPNPALQAMVATMAAFLFLAGMVTVIGALTFKALPLALWRGQNGSFPVTGCVIGAVLILLGCGFGFWTLAMLNPIEPGIHRRDASDILFARYLIGIGYFLFVDAIINIVAFAGIAYSGGLNYIFPFGNGDLARSAERKDVHLLADRILGLFDKLIAPDQNVILVVVLMLSMGMALLGSLFYFANSLWQKFQSRTEFFNCGIFWGGLWFRLAEAIVLTIAMFLFLRFKGFNTNYMPVIALLIGTTVKSSESLIFGLAERTLASVASLVSPRSPTEERISTAPIAPAANAGPEFATAGALKEFLQRFFDQTELKDRIRSISVQPGSISNTSTVTIQASLVQDPARRDLLIAEIRRTAYSALRAKGVQIERVDVEPAVG